MGGGGFQFGMLADVQMLGFYPAQHARTHKPFLAYVLQVSTTASTHYLIYRRYSQIASLATKLHFHPVVGLPPKYALQVFPLTDAQLQQRFEGLNAFLAHVFQHLQRAFADGAHHDVHSTAGLDMQIFSDFVAFQRNRPPQATTHSGVPHWALPTALHRSDSNNSADASSSFRSRASSLSSNVSSDDFATTTPIHHRRSSADVTDATETDALQRQDASNRFRNELLEAESNVYALWNCVQALEHATQAWAAAASAVADEYKRVRATSLLQSTLASSDSANSLQLAAQLAGAFSHVATALTPAFSRTCATHVLAPLEALVRDVLPDIKHAYWTRLATNATASTTGQTYNATASATVRRLLLERDALHRRVQTDVDASMRALVASQNELLTKVLEAVTPFENAETKKHENDNDADDASDAGAIAADQTHWRRDAGDPSDVETVTTALDVCSAEAIPAASASVAVFASTDMQDESIAQLDDAPPNDDNGAGTNDSTDALPQSRVWVWGRLPTIERGTPLVLRPKQVAVLNGQSMLQVACGGEHLLYLTDTGDVYSFGDSDEHQRANKRSGATTTTNSFNAPRLVEEFALEKALHRTKIVTVACGAQHSVGITEVGELYTWGSGEDGRLGHGDMRDRTVPRKVIGLLRERVVHASCGGAHTAVLTDLHAVYTFGRGRNGRLGLGDTKWRDSPHTVTAFDRTAAIVHVVCGWNFTAALGRDGSVYTWGKQGEGQCGLGYTDTDQLVPRVVDRLLDVRVVDIACGYTHTLALTAAGEIYSWGLGEYGQLGRGVVYQPVPEIVDMANVLGAPDSVDRVYCGAFHSVATTRARVLFAWGLNLYGACGLGHTSNKDTPARVASFAATASLVVACGHKYTIALEVTQEAVVPPHKVALAATQPRQLATTRRLSGMHPPPPLTISIASSASQSQSIRLQSPTDADTNGNGGALDWWDVGESDVLSPTHSEDNGDDATSPLFAASPSGSRGGSFSVRGSLDSATRETIHEREQALRRAKKLWRTRILRDWDANKDTPLAHAMWREGIPPSIRAKVWPLAIGNRLKITPDMYRIYRRRAVAYKLEEQSSRSSSSTNKDDNDTSSGTSSSTSSKGIGREYTLALIDTDLPRTFPTLQLFDASGPYYDFLLEVLETYACYRPDLGYIQGMSYLAALLCLHLSHSLSSQSSQSLLTSDGGRYLTFQCLANLMVHEHLFTFYLLDAELARVYYALFDALLRSRLPALHAHLHAIGVPSALYVMNWLQTLFLQVLPLELAARVVDNFLLDGTVFLLRTAVAIHELLQVELLAMDMDEALPLLQKNASPQYQDVWRTRVSEATLFHTIAAIAVPSPIFAMLDRVVNNAFFYDKQRSGASGASTSSTNGFVRSEQQQQHNGSGQSVGIGRVQHERRRMYSISDTLNGVLGGF